LRTIFATEACRAGAEAFRTRSRATLGVYNAAVAHKTQANGLVGVVTIFRSEEAVTVLVQGHGIFVSAAIIASTISAPKRKEGEDESNQHSFLHFQAPQIRDGIGCR
jgi:hypothetical protein